eukprot:4080867-Pyramimonas_sp.AAC.1
MLKYYPRDSNATDQPDCCVLTILNSARKPFLGLQHRESTQLLRPPNLESFSNSMSGTWTMGTM